MRTFDCHPAPNPNHISKTSVVKTSVAHLQQQHGAIDKVAFHPDGMAPDMHALLRCKVVHLIDEIRKKRLQAGT
jgi:hypothetical protein